MSKIEEALRRARAERAEEMAASGGVAPGRDSWPAVERQAVASRASRELVGVSAAEEIARMREERPRGPAELAQLRIIDKETTDPRVADAFRQLRTSLMRKSGDKNFILAVMSATGNGGGASFVALNLAAAIAFDENKTALVVNGNLLNPFLDSLVQTEGEVAGLTDFLAGKEKAVERIIHPIGIPRLRVVPAGRQNRSAMEYFTAPQLGHLLRGLRQRYRERYIIIDAPPVTQSADARILSELADY
ncbi:MAG TPA: CpsD/CapB family tyrosine-protein kinase, partial [Gammaproteobacteria bacterium]|nr:CpsD/CapB family tyrosine-protein kinase [Gammaproteobacteria bacterium]